MKIKNVASASAQTTCAVDNHPTGQKFPTFM
jgi:hypothetical protein